MLSLSSTRLAIHMDIHMEVRAIPSFTDIASACSLPRGLVAADISSRNIAFTCGQLSQATKEDLFSVLGQPEVDNLIRLDGQPINNNLPKQIVNVATWGDWTEGYEEDLRVIDFGEAFMHGEEPERLAQPGALRVPESIFTDTLDYRLDLWRTGIVVRTMRFCKAG